ncbi:hypothetical protein Paz_05 [Xylella phage Paz]|uniref:Uncharacterized protein n=1 Tax=Xylella phage Paz TaxID=1415145 RepID=V5Q7I5_9CAUD|nr:hypothetical protein Paz_05 [Xylella phage Paz]AHB12102.1 hypothetical protein Paz_05 [Xylella phage Paz]
MAKYKGRYRELARRLDRLIETGAIRLFAERHTRGQIDGEEFIGTYLAGGFRLVGYGYYSQVFSHWRAPGVVFKYTFDDSDCMLYVARAFMELMHENLPEVHMIHSVEVEETTEYGTRVVRTHGVVVAERLLACPEGLTSREMRELQREAERAVADPLDEYRIRLSDMHSGNIMWRGDTCVINDPTTYVRKK